MIKGWAETMTSGTSCGSSEPTKPTSCGTGCGAGDNK